MPQSESVQHPASLSCRGQTAKISPSSTLFPTHKKAAGTGGGFSTGGDFQYQRHFPKTLHGIVKLLALPEKKIKILPDSSVMCLFPPGFYKSARTGSLGACIEG